MPDFYPDIEEYLESTTNTRSVSSKGLDELVFRVRAATGLDYDVAQQLVRNYFQEIRNAMLRGDIVALRGLGKFFISSPLHGNKEQVFPKFEPFTLLSDRLNNE